MRVIGRLLGFLVRTMVLASVAGVAVAVATKRGFEARDEADADDVRLGTFFGPMAFKSTATSFRGGTLDCWYGGGIVDLREARLDPAGATLRVRAVFGGAQIVVPESWEVSHAVVGIGGVGDTRPHVDRGMDAPRLRIEGLAVFGGFGVGSDVPDEQVDQLRRAVARRQGATA